MSLRIGKLATRCRAPPGQEGADAVVDAVAREVLPRELAAKLGRSLDRQPAVLRLKLLNVPVSVDIATLQRGGLAKVWTAALARALHEALARPDGDGTMLRRFESPAAYSIAMITHILSDATRHIWQFPELAGREDRPTAILVLELLLETGPLLAGVLEELHRARALEAVLVRLEEVGLERLMRAVTKSESGTSALTVNQFMAIGSVLAAQHVPPLRGQAVSRRQAIGIWLQLDRALPLRGIWYALQLLLRLLEEPSLLAPWVGAAGLGAEMPAWCEAVRLELGQILLPSIPAATALSPNAPAETRQRFAQALSANAAAMLDQLQVVTPSAAKGKPGIPEQWLQSDSAGLLLLCDTVRRSGWARLRRDAEFGARAFQALLAGAGMCLLRRWEPREPVDPVAALFAGCLEEVDRHGLAQVFAETPLAALTLFRDVTSLSAALEAAADELAAAFGAQIRGFRGAGRQSIVRHFLRVPGRILIEKTALRVVLEPSPWAVALHVSGADDPVESADWLEGRRVSFVLEGL
jgi:hypothetical protein